MGHHLHLRLHAYRPLRHLPAVTAGFEERLWLEPHAPIEEVETARREGIDDRIEVRTQRSARAHVQRTERGECQIHGSVQRERTYVGPDERGIGG